MINQILNIISSITVHLHIHGIMTLYQECKIVGIGVIALKNNLHGHFTVLHPRANYAVQI